MPKTCYLHIGFHKTASSSFQQACYKNRKLLEHSGIIYPVFECSQAGRPAIANHSIPLASLFSRKPENLHQNIRWGVSSNIKSVNASYQKTLADAFDSNKNVLLSAERLSISPANELEGLISYMEKRGYDIIPFGLVRSPYSFGCSAIQEIIKGGNYVDLVSFNNEICSGRNEPTMPAREMQIRNLMSRWGSKLKLYPFSLACKHDYGPVGFLMTKMNLCDPLDLVYQQRNESKSNTWVRLQNLVNQHEPAFNGQKYNSSHFQVSQIIECKDKFLLTAEELAIVENQVEQQNIFYRAALGPDFCDRAVSISKPLDFHKLGPMLVGLARLSALMHNNASVLRDIVIKHEAMKPLAIEDANFLMSLAHLARPEDLLIRQKLNRYKELSSNRNDKIGESKHGLK